MPDSLRDLAVYIHWPFCASKCPYCDFNSHVSDRIEPDAWARAYVDDLRYARDLVGPRHVKSMFFGGGTPSLMPPHIPATIIQTVRDLWAVDDHIEITLEANPTSIEADKFKGFRDAGINRVSVGIQSLNDADLKFLGRAHSATDARRALDIAASTFDRFTFDLIYARPNQTPEMWAQELSDALKIAGDHLSLYQLTIEEGTPFYTRHARGEFQIPDENMAAELYSLTDDMMTAVGRPAYEVSNYARPNQESRHNLAYWQYDDYVGIGPGAHGRITLNGVKYATRAHRAPEAWLDLVRSSGNGLHPFTVVPSSERGTESIMMGLRLTRGFDLNKITAETGRAWGCIIHPERLAAMIQSGDVIQTGTKIQATLAGRLRLNQLLAYLLGG
jgi:putative oxygen-independent coproporphyrinogen III oxidase